MFNCSLDDLMLFHITWLLDLYQYLMLVWVFLLSYLQAAGALSIKIGKFDEYLQIGFFCMILI